MWWLFSNKNRQKSLLEFNFNHKLRSIEDSLRNSFFNIKKDIAKINTFIYHHDNNIAHLKERILFLESNIRDLKESRRYERHEKLPIQESNDLDYEEEPIQESKKSTFTVNWEDLTNIQQNILLRLGLLQIESSQKRIAMKHLAEELYPEKEYNDVRSMFSDYINLLNEYGLVKKTRKGRQIFISVTESGALFYDKNKRKKLLEVLRKN